MQRETVIQFRFDRISHDWDKGANIVRTCASAWLHACLSYDLSIETIFMHRPADRSIDPTWTFYTSQCYFCCFFSTADRSCSVYKIDRQVFCCCAGRAPICVYVYTEFELETWLRTRGREESEEVQLYLKSVRVKTGEKREREKKKTTFRLCKIRSLSQHNMEGNWRRC